MKFDAIKGTQAGKDFYTVTMPLKRIQNFINVNSGVVRKSSIRKIKEYILENPRKFVFSSITTVIDDPIKFKPISGNIGELSVPIDSQITVIDGVHRCMAIGEAVATKPSLGNQSIPMVIFEAKGRNAKNMASDLHMERWSQQK